MARTKSQSPALLLDGSPLDWARLEPLAGAPLRVEVADAAWQRVRRSRQLCEEIARRPTATYGLNTGFGALCTTRIAPDRIEQLQENLILSHSVGVGPPLPDELVRWMMLFKLHALLMGHSGVREETLRCLLDLLNADVLPVIPTRGSLGASGDLAPLAHLVLPMLGRGQARCAGKTLPGADALRAAAITPVRLAAKEGLSLINGTQFMTACGADVILRARRLLKSADVIGSMSVEALQGSHRPFDARLHEVRPHPGAQSSAANLRHLLRESEIAPAHANCGKVQDPYSLRCIPQVHGASRDALDHAADVVLRDINSVTDNPLLFDNGDVISGGNFHGQPLALALDYAAIALAELAAISERRTYLLLSGHDGLPPILVRDSGVNTGLMIVQYTAAALVSENKVLAHPASVDSIPTSLGQEDHVSMGATAGLKCRQILEHAETVLAIELLCASQALDFRLPLRAGLGPRAAHAAVRQSIPHVDADREFAADIVAATALVRSGTVLSAAEAAGCNLR